MANSKSLSSRKKKKLLSSSRPKISSQVGTVTSSQLSSRRTRALIRTHHTLQKQLHRAETAGDAALASSLAAELASKGGLQVYQAASKAGQSAQRGGDSSKVLVQWLREAGFRPFPKVSSSFRVLVPDESSSPLQGSRLRLLEVGALNLTNACATCGLFAEVERIDLHSTTKGILQQDFMKRPVPQTEEEKRTQGFDVVSLSLVVNYVPDAAHRGEMLARVCNFLRSAASSGLGGIAESSEQGEEQRIGGYKNEGDDLSSAWFPGLFLVLPAACVANSRYLDSERLEAMMQALGYEVIRRKVSAKLVYYYLHFDVVKKATAAKPLFAKKEVRKGGGRNNFAIVLQ